MNFRRFLFLFAGMIVASMPINVSAQLGARCSSLKDIYVLARGIYSFTVSGSCIYSDGHHSPYLTKAAYNALQEKPKVNVFY